MSKEYYEQIQRFKYYELRTGKGIYDSSGFKCLNSNAHINTKLFIKMIGIEECSPEKDERLHTFECNTLHFIMSGKGNFDGIMLGKGDGFMVKKNQIAEYSPDKNNPWTYCWINFDGEFSDYFTSSVGLTEEKCTFSCFNLQRISKLISSALNEDYSKINLSIYLDSVLLEIFACLTSDEPEPFIQRSESAREQRVIRSIEFIKENYKFKNCIDRLAENENTDKRYISKLFREFSDRSPQAHLIRVRLEKAKELLQTSSLSIGEIAAAVGYDDPLQFSKIFRKHTGTSPANYRKGTEDIHREYD